MNKKIVLGSLLAVFLMLMIPNVSALEYKITENEKNRYIETLIRENYQNFERIRNDLWELFGIFLNVFGIISNLYFIINNPERAVPFILMAICHCYILYYLLKSD